MGFIMSIETLRCEECKKETNHAIIDFGKVIKTKCLVCGNLKIAEKEGYR